MPSQRARAPAAQSASKSPKSQNSTVQGTDMEKDPIGPKTRYDDPRDQHAKVLFYLKPGSFYR
jgi:hypothetical protein